MDSNNPHTTPRTDNLLPPDLAGRAVGARHASFRETLYGNTKLESGTQLRPLELSAGCDVQYGAALALASAGAGGSRAQALVGGLRRPFPEDTFVQFICLRKYWVDFDDFFFYRMDVLDVYYVGGFGVM